MFKLITQLFEGNKGTRKNFVKKCVLIVDDNESDRLLVQRTVEKMGHRVLTAGNGKIGFEVAKADRPDLILSDCRMPEADGVELCKWLKSDVDTKDIPMVFLTEISTPKTVVECFDLGVDNYICKPINAKLLTAQIKTIFENVLPAD